MEKHGKRNYTQLETFPMLCLDNFGIYDQAPDFVYFYRIYVVIYERRIRLYLVRDRTDEYLNVVIPRKYVKYHVQVWHGYDRQWLYFEEGGYYAQYGVSFAYDIKELNTLPLKINSLLLQLSTLSGTKFAECAAWLRKSPLGEYEKIR